MSEAFWAVYPGEISRTERVALARHRLIHHENGDGLPAAYRAADGGFPAAYQVIRLSAASADLARRTVVEALGREPDQLRVHKGLGEDGTAE